MGNKMNINDLMSLLKVQAEKEGRIIVSRESSSSNLMSKMKLDSARYNEETKEMNLVGIDDFNFVCKVESVEFDDEEDTWNVTEKEGVFVYINII